jgi:hypothetical protein
MRRQRREVGAVEAGEKGVADAIGSDCDGNAELA